MPGPWCKETQSQQETTVLQQGPGWMCKISGTESFEGFEVWTSLWFIKFRFLSCLKKMRSLLTTDIPLCASDLSQVVNSTQRPRRRDRTVSQPRKRKRSPASSSSRPPKTSVPPSAISHDDLPVSKKLPPRPEPCSTDHQPTSSSDSTLKIYNFSVEDYQRVYHEVVDSMLTYVCLQMSCHFFKSPALKWLQYGFWPHASFWLNFFLQVQAWPQTSLQFRAGEKH